MGPTIQLLAPIVEVRLRSPLRKKKLQVLLRIIYINFCQVHFNRYLYTEIYFVPSSELLKKINFMDFIVFDSV